MSAAIGPVNPSQPGALLPVRVGRALFGIPRGSRVTHPDGNRATAIVLGPDGYVTVVTESGPISVPPHLQAEIAARYFAY